MSTNRTHYDILGVADNATSEQITKNYRALALQCHPDKFPGDLEKAGEFAKLAEAYRVLGDQVLRQWYDDSLTRIEEDVFEVAEANTYTEGDNLSLVVSSAHSLESIVTTAGIKIFNLYYDARNDSALAMSLFTNQNLFKILTDNHHFYKAKELAEIHEQVALLVVDKDFAHTKHFDCYKLARKFPSVRNRVLEAENKSAMITTEQEKVLRELDLGIESEELERKEKTSEDNPTVALTKDPQLLALEKLSAEERVVSAKSSLQVARLLIDNPWLELPDEYNHMPSIIFIASHHEEIALKLFDDARYYRALRQYVRDGKVKRIKSAIFLARTFPSVNDKIVNAKPGFNHHPYDLNLSIKKFNTLLSDDLSPLRDESQKHRMSCYRELLAGNFDGLSDEDILKLIAAASLKPNELKKLIVVHKKLADLVYQNDRYFDLIDRAFAGWVSAGMKYEDVALRLMKEKRLASNHLGSLIEVMTITWLSVCKYVLCEPTLASRLTGKELLGLEKKHGVVVTRLISAAGLHEKLHAYVIYEAAKTRAGGFNTQKKSTRVAEKQDKSEPLLQRGLLIKSELIVGPHRDSKEIQTQIDLMREYFYQAAKMGNEYAYEELCASAREEDDFQFWMLAIEAACIAGKRELAADAIEAMKVSVESLADFLFVVQNRLALADNQTHLATVGNLYFDMIVSLMEDENFSADPAIYLAYRCLADMFKEHEPGIALQFVAQIPLTHRDDADLINMADWALANAYNKQLAESLVSEQSDAAALELPINKAQRYCAALPYYLRISLKNERAKTVMERMVKELVDFPLPESQKGLMFLEMAWSTIAEDKVFIGQAKLAWEKASEFKNDIAIYIMKNYDEMQQNKFLFTSLKLISQQNLTSALALLDRARALPVTYQAARQQFINFLSEDGITEEMILARSARLEKLHMLAQTKKNQCESLLVGLDASLALSVKTFYEQDFSDPDVDSDIDYIQFKAKVVKQNKRIADSKKHHVAVTAAIDSKLTELIDQFHLAAYRHRAQGSDDEAVCCGIKADILSELKTKLLNDTSHYFSQDFGLDSAPADETAFRDQMIATINHQLTSINQDLKENVSWFTWVAYNLVRALQAIFPCFASVASWMHSFNESFTIVPRVSQRDDINNTIIVGLN